MDFNKYNKLKDTLSNSQDFELNYLNIKMFADDVSKLPELFIEASVKQIPEKIKEENGTKYILSGYVFGEISFFSKTDDINFIISKFKQEVASLKQKELNRLQIAIEEREKYIQSCKERIEVVNKYWK